MRIEDARQLFKAVDMDSNGRINFLELVHFLTAILSASPFLPADV